MDITNYPDFLLDLYINPKCKGF